MKRWKIWTTITVAAVLTLLAGGAGAIQDGIQPDAIVSDQINYQGWLTDLGGTSLNGTYPMRFQLYDDPTAGSMWWESPLIEVEVDHGRFSVDLDIPTQYFDGMAFWLQIYVNGEWLSPRQELLAVPYAIGLRPGARLVADTPGSFPIEVFQLSSLATGGAVRAVSATGTAIQGSSNDGFGLAGFTQDNYAVYGFESGYEQGTGYGGYFHSNSGIGVYGFSNAIPYMSNAYTPGVYGRSANGVGVYGLSDSGSSGVRGESDGTGVYGRSEAGTGVYGYTAGTDSDDYGVYGRAEGLASGVYGYQTSTIGGLGVLGRNDGTGAGTSGYNTADGTGTWGYSYNYNGLAGMTNRGDDNYGVYTLDNLYSANYHTTGALMQIVQNGGDETLEQGDLVAIAGMANSPAAGTNAAPMLSVRKAQGANSTAVVGVVASTYPAEWLDEPGKTDPTGAGGPEKTIPSTDAGPVAPGEYLLIVVQGPCQVKAESLGGAIQPGDLLSSAEQAGRAAKAATLTMEGIETAVPGTVFGKAMEALDGGQGLIYVFVTLQ